MQLNDIVKLLVDANSEVTVEHLLSALGSYFEQDSKLFVEFLNKRDQIQNLFGLKIHLQFDKIKSGISSYAPNNAKNIAITLAIADLVNLVQYGLDINIRNSYRLTALSVCIHNDWEKGAKDLLRAGADPNLESHELTPLQSAINNGNPDLVKLLKQYGAHETAQAMSTLDAVTIYANWEADQSWTSPILGKFSIEALHDYIEDSKKEPVEIPLPELEKAFKKGTSDEKVGTPEFKERSDESDLSYPIIVIEYDDEDDKYSIADGRHRFVKARNKYGKDGSIEAYIIKENELDQLPRMKEK
jgi:hypothetical protein